MARRGLVGVALCFLLATAFAQHLESAIAGRAHDLISNAMPSVQLLSTARGDLRQLQRGVDRYTVADPTERVELRDQLSATQQDLDAALASYRALPYCPNERALFAPVEDDVSRLNQQLAKLGDTIDPATLASVHRRFDLVDQAIQRVESFDAEQGRGLGLKIERDHGDARGTLVLLDAASVGLAR